MPALASGRCSFMAAVSGARRERRVKVGAPIVKIA